MRYYASFTANGGSTYLSKAWEYNNKKAAIREVKHICRENHHQQAGNISTARVEDEHGNTVYLSQICGISKRWRVIIP